MADALIKHEAIQTTLPKAMALRAVVEQQIAPAQDAAPAHRRLAFRRMRGCGIVPSRRRCRRAAPLSFALPDYLSHAGLARALAILARDASP